MTDSASWNICSRSGHAGRPRVGERLKHLLDSPLLTAKGSSSLHVPSVCRPHGLCSICKPLLCGGGLIILPAIPHHTIVITAALARAHLFRP